MMNSDSDIEEIDFYKIISISNVYYELDNVFGRSNKFINFMRNYIYDLAYNIIDHSDEMVRDRTCIHEFKYYHQFIQCVLEFALNNSIYKDFSLFVGEDTTIVGDNDYYISLTPNEDNNYLLEVSLYGSNEKSITKTDEYKQLITSNWIII